MMLTREAITDALRFWEIGRLAYNLALAAVAIGGALLNGVPLEEALGWLPALIFLAVVANVLYCAAYPIDLLVQASEFRELWRQWRWILWVSGTAFAALVAVVLLFGQEASPF